MTSLIPSGSSSLNWLRFISNDECRLGFDGSDIVGMVLSTFADLSVRTTTRCQVLGFSRLTTVLVVCLPRFV